MACATCWNLVCFSHTTFCWVKLAFRLHLHQATHAQLKSLVDVFKKGNECLGTLRTRYGDSASKKAAYYIKVIQVKLRAKLNRAKAEISGESKTRKIIRMLALCFIFLYILCYVWSWRLCKLCTIRASYSFHACFEWLCENLIRCMCAMCSYVCGCVSYARSAFVLCSLFLCHVCIWWLCELRTVGSCCMCFMFVVCYVCFVWLCELCTVGIWVMCFMFVLCLFRMVMWVFWGRYVCYICALCWFVRLWDLYDSFLCFVLMCALNVSFVYSYVSYG